MYGEETVIYAVQSEMKRRKRSRSSRRSSSGRSRQKR